MRKLTLVSLSLSYHTKILSGIREQDFSTIVLRKMGHIMKIPNIEKEFRIIQRQKQEEQLDDVECEELTLQQQQQQLGQSGSPQGHESESQQQQYQQSRLSNTRYRPHPHPRSRYTSSPPHYKSVSY